MTGCRLNLGFLCVFASPAKVKYIGGYIFYCGVFRFCWATSEPFFEKYGEF
jgi:hypothetical protein